MFRTAIFCFYDKEGKVGRYIDYLLDNLKKVIDFLIIVVNGEIKEEARLRKYANILIVRENKGYDICAYKEALHDSSCLKIIKNSEELIFVNNSFYGPFVPFSSIFDDMKDKNADFWGIASVEYDFDQYIASYFYVFRKKILDGKELFQYIDKHVDLKGMGYSEVCEVFENGLFAKLVEVGYSYDAYRQKIRYSMYNDPYESIVCDKVPILKRKVFSNMYFDEKKAGSTISVIKANYDYDISLIIDDVKDTYGMDISNIPYYEEKKKNTYQNGILSEVLIEKIEIIRFINKFKSVYIYGCGEMAAKLFRNFFFYKDNPSLKGFIVSDNQKDRKEIYKGYPVYFWSEVKNNKELAILVALNKKNSLEVFEGLRNITNKKFVWKSIDVE